MYGMVLYYSFVGGCNFGVIDFILWYGRKL